MSMNLFVLMQSKEKHQSGALEALSSAFIGLTWWLFSVLLALGEGYPRVVSLHKGPGMWSFGVFFFVSMNKLLNKILIVGDLQRHGAHAMHK